MIKLKKANKIGQFDKLTVSINMLYAEKQALQKQIDIVDKKINKLKKGREETATQGITVTEHAIERFKERIINIPERKIKQMLRSETLLNMIKVSGSGKYVLPEMPMCTVAVEDFTIVTVYNRHDPFYKLDMLSHYMKYWVNMRVRSEFHDVEIMDFKEFSKKQYNR